jgi:catechol 2,3-dioxygenase-like lactoylglutathione lyase family enzyme
MPSPLNHMHLHVADLDRTTEFYRRYFGMAVASDHGSIRFLTDGNGFLLALEPGEPAVMPDWFHFGFWLPDNAAVRAAFERAVAAGDRVLDEYRVRKHGGAVFAVADPDGYAVEVYHDPPSCWGDQPPPSAAPAR